MCASVFAPFATPLLFCTGFVFMPTDGEFRRYLDAPRCDLTGCYPVRVPRAGRNSRAGAELTAEESVANLEEEENPLLYQVVRAPVNGESGEGRECGFPGRLAHCGRGSVGGYLPPSPLCP